MATEQSSPIRPFRARALEHIEIHEDAIHVTQNNVHPSSTELETDLAAMNLNRRTPLEELDLKAVQHDIADDCDIQTLKAQHKIGEVEARSADEGINFSAVSSEARLLPTYAQDISSSEALSPANHKIHFDREAATEQTTKTIREQEASTVARSPLCLQKRHMATTAVETSKMRANQELPAIEISKRQQGEAEEDTSELEGTKTLPLTPKPATESFTTMAKRSVSNKENLEPIATPLRDGSLYDVLEAAVVEAATPPTNIQPSSFALSTAVDAISSLAELDQAIDQIDQDTLAAPESPASLVASETSEKSALILPVDQADSKPEARVKKAPVVRTTRAAQARISLAHGSKDVPRPPAWGRPRESIGSFRQSIGPAQRNASGVSASSITDGEKKAVIPHSKPRPMSMSFPTPPPPPKSTKAPTRSTFALPGEAVAAKLKAARQEREKTVDQPQVFKARPIPDTIKNAPVVRQTTTSRARESLGPGKEVLAQRAHLQQGHQRASSVASVRPADKRQSISIRPKPIATAIIKEVSAPRPSTSLANISKPRIASPADIARGHNAKAQAPAKSVKGREVFSRTAFATEAADVERRAKEEATRKARAEAAERSRQLSREWAEKKRREKLSHKTEVTSA